MSLAVRLLLAAALAASACVVHGATAEIPGDLRAFSVPLTSLKETMAYWKFRSTVRQRYDFSCGSAALATLLTYHYETPITEQEAIEAMYVGGDETKIRREGFSLLDIKRYLEGRGFHADGFEATLEQVTQFGAPGIVLLQDKGYRHFVVLKGVRDNRVLLGDPALGARVLPRAEFERLWVNHVFFVIHSHRKQARFNVADQWQRSPRAVLGDALDRNSLMGITLMRPDPATEF